ncbi:MAG: PAS domain-containing protein [Rhizomicrobium sp.]
MTDDKTPVTRTDPVTGQNLRIEFEEIAALAHVDAIALLDYWHGCRRAGHFAMLRDVPAKPIARLTKHLVVLEPLPDFADFRYRVAGTVMIERIGRDVTGMLISDVFDTKPAEGLIGAARKVIETDGPVFERIHVQGLFEAVRRPELVMLPVGSIDAKETWVLVGVFYHA